MPCKAQTMNLHTRINFQLPKNRWYQFQSLGGYWRRMFILFPSINKLIVAIPQNKRIFENALLQPGSIGDSRLYPSWFHSTSFHEGQRPEIVVLFGVCGFTSGCWKPPHSIVWKFSVWQRHACFKGVAHKKEFSSDRNSGYSVWQLYDIFIYCNSLYMGYHGMILPS